MALSILPEALSKKSARFVHLRRISGCVIQQECIIFCITKVEAYTDLPQRGHLSTSTIFLANFEGLVGVEGRAGFGDPLKTEVFRVIKCCSKRYPHSRNLILLVDVSFVCLIVL